MIGYLQYRRERITSYERPTLRVWLISTGYQIKARTMHRYGRHTYQEIWPDGAERSFLRCTWCGHSRLARRNS